MHILRNSFQWLGNNQNWKSKLQKHLVTFSFSVTVYSLWLERNRRLFQKIKRNESIVITEILENVKYAACSWKGYKRSKSNWELAMEMGIPHNILVWLSFQCICMISCFWHAVFFGTPCIYQVISYISYFLYLESTCCLFIFIMQDWHWNTPMYTFTKLFLLNPLRGTWGSRNLDAGIHKSQVTSFFAKLEKDVEILGIMTCIMWTPRLLFNWIAVFDLICNLVLTSYFYWWLVTLVYA